MRQHNLRVTGSLTVNGENVVSASQLSALNSTLTGQYATTGSNMYNGNQTITGSVIVTGTITANEFHTTFVTSSVLYTSGSTKFGDTNDDIMEVTGSLKVDGNITANNLSGIVSGSSQITSLLPTGVVSGSSQLTASYDVRYVISGSITQTTWDNIASKPSGIVSASSQTIPSFGTYSSINNTSYSGSITVTNPLVTRDASNYRYYGTGSKVDISGSILQYENTNVFTRNDNAILTVIFRAINPFDANSASNQETWAFNAYIDGYKDNFDATWNDVNYVGRSESFYIYNKFKRTVNFNLKIPCFNKTQLFEKHRALGQLASVTAGSYKSLLSPVLGGVLIKINLGNYLVGEYAVLNNVSYSIPDDASWDIADDALLSMYIDASFSLTIVHKKLPEYRQSSKTVLDNGFFGHLPNPVNSTQATKTGYIAPPNVISKFSKDK